MLFHTVLVSAILPPRRQWCHVDVSRGAVREQNLHSTPKRRPVGDVMCTVAVHAIIDCGEQLDLRAAKSAVRAEKKETKAQLSRARKPRRGVQWGKAPLDFRLTRSGSTTGWGQRKNAAANKLSPELGSAVSGVVENLSRKIHIENTKSSAPGVENVYILWWVSGWTHSTVVANKGRKRE